MKENQPLLESYKLEEITIENRVVMEPMTRNSAENNDNAPTCLHAEYYKQCSGAELIITEGSQFFERAVGYINTPGIYTAAKTEGWKIVTSVYNISLPISI